MIENKKLARIAGVLYLFLAITGVYGLIYVGSQTYVRGDFYFGRALRAILSAKLYLCF
jgi:hypothetical protein